MTESTQSVSTVPTAPVTPAVPTAPVTPAVPTFSIEVVRINKVASGKRMGFLDIKVNNLLTLKGFAVFNGSKGLFVSPPKDKGKDGKFYTKVFFDGIEYDNLQKVCLERWNK